MKFGYSVLFLFFVCSSFCQNQTTCLTICDKETRLPVSDVHVFISNTTFGSISSTEGKIHLSFSTAIKEDMIISHVAYSSLLLAHKSYSRASNCDTLFLEPNHVDFGQIEIVAKRSKKWKKQYKKFRKYFVGADKNASLCVINNPEVLRFDEDQNGLTVTSVDMLDISNSYLGYNLNYLLTHCRIENDGSSSYAGKTIFKEIEEPTINEDILENRKKTL